MSARRAALLEKFRHRARARIAELRRAIGMESRPIGEAWTEPLGALHTLKGEARMLGLGAIAELAHGLEEALHSGAERWPLDVPRLDRGLLLLDRMVEGSLDAEAESALVREASQLFEAARDESGEMEVPAAVRATDATSPGDTRERAGSRAARTRVVDVTVTQIDGVCEDAERVRSTLAKLVLEGSAGRAALEDLLARAEALAERAWEMRLAPVEPLLHELAAHAEELARTEGKPLAVTVDAAGTSLDRAVLDALAEPLLHLVRNAVDHGVETADRRVGKAPVAKLVLSAVPRAGGVDVSVEDDGSGIEAARVRRAAVTRGVLREDEAAALSDDDAIDLVFRAGFSTRERANEVSGRGLGLDVVRRVAESMGGAAVVASKPSAGTRFTVSVPVGLARERVLVLPIAGAIFGVSARHVASIVALEGRVERVAGGRALRTEDGLVPLVSFAKLVGRAPTEDEATAIVVAVGERRWALTVARIEGERDVLRRPADRALASFGVAGASAVLDDGRPVLLPSLAELVRRRGVRGVAAAERPTPASSVSMRMRRALVVDDSPIVRELVAELVGSIGFAVTTSADGQEALEALDTQAFDVIVSDFEMPRVDGLELLRRVRARGLSTPVVMVTTRGSVEDRRRAAELGADAYVVKTAFREGELLDTVKRLAGGPS